MQTITSTFPSNQAIHFTMNRELQNNLPNFETFISYVSYIYRNVLKNFLPVMTLFYIFSKEGKEIIKETYLSKTIDYYRNLLIHDQTTSCLSLCDHPLTV